MRLVPTLLLLSLSLTPALVAAESRSATSASAAALIVEPDGPRITAALAELDRAIALGLPDAKGGTLVHGPVVISVKTADGDDDTETFEGLHVRRADGSWLIQLRWPIAPSATVAITAEGGKDLTPADLFAQARDTDEAEHEQMERWIEAYPPVEQGMLRSTRAISALWEDYDLHGDMGPTLMALYRVGVPRPMVARLVVTLAIAQDWQMQRTAQAAKAPLLLTQRTGEDPEFMMDGDVSGITASATRAVVKPSLPDFATSVSTGLYGQFRAQITNPWKAPWQGLTQAQALTGAEAFIVAAKGNAAELAMLKAASALPEQPAADATMAQRLASWPESGWQGSWQGAAPTAFVERMNGDDGQTDYLIRALTEQDNLDDQQRKYFEEQLTQHGGTLPKSWTWQDLGPLIALVGDTGASRWIQQGVPRTVGDNALRALVKVLSFDPRLLVGRNPGAPWNAAERAATAKDLQAWWPKNQQRTRDDLMTEVLPKLQMTEVLVLVQRSKGPAREALFTTLAAQWKTYAPASRQGYNGILGNILALGRGNASFSTTVDAWPRTGAHAELLQAWHALKGDTKDFDQAFAAACAPSATGAAGAATADEQEGQGFGPFGQSQPPLIKLLPLAFAVPSPERLQAVQNLLKGDLAVEPTASLLSFMVNGMNQGSAYQALLQPEQDRPNGQQAKVRQEAQRRVAMPLLLVLGLLAEQRPPPVEMTKQQQQQLGWYLASLEDHGNGEQTEPKEKEGHFPEDLRTCDLIAMGMRNVSHQVSQAFGWEAVQPMQELRFDPTAPKAERDAKLAEMRQLLADFATTAAAAAGLPSSQIPATAPAGEPLF